MTDLELGFGGVVVFTVLFAAGIGWYMGWSKRGEWDEGVARHFYREGRKSAADDIAKQFKIELGVVKAEKDLKRELLGK